MFTGDYVKAQAELHGQTAGEPRREGAAPPPLDFEQSFITWQPAAEDKLQSPSPSKVMKSLKMEASLTGAYAALPTPAARQSPHNRCWGGLDP